MSFEDFKESLKNQLYGKDLLEAEEQFLKSADELDARLSSYVLWLTGLAVGEIAFILSNLEDIFKNRGSLFFITATLLLLSIFGGLVYQLIRVISKVFRKQIASFERQVSVIFWSRNSDVDKDDSKRLDKLNKLLVEYIEKSMLVPTWMNLSAFLNIFTYFLGSFTLVLLIIQKLLGRY